MRILTRLACLACLTLAGCAATAQTRPDDRPNATSQTQTGYCSSSGGGVACAATIAVISVLHSVQD